MTANKLQETVGNFFMAWGFSTNLHFSPLVSPSFTTTSHLGNAADEFKPSRGSWEWPSKEVSFQPDDSKRHFESSVRRTRETGKRNTSVQAPVYRWFVQNGRLCQHNPDLFRSYFSFYSSKTTRFIDRSMVFNNENTAISNNGFDLVEYGLSSSQ